MLDAKRVANPALVRRRDAVNDPDGAGSPVSGLKRGAYCGGPGVSHAHGGAFEDMAKIGNNRKSRTRKGNQPGVVAEKCSRHMGPPRVLLIDAEPGLCESIATAMSRRLPGGTRRNLGSRPATCGRGRSGCPAALSFQ